MTRMREQYSLPLKQGITLLTLNMTTAGAWITFFIHCVFSGLPWRRPLLPVWHRF